MAKVLIVDDDKILLNMYKFKFKRRKYDVDTAGDGMEAMERIFTFHPDIILLDIMMPVVDGYELLTKIKSNEQIKSIPVVLLTNLSSTKENIQKGQNMGAVTLLAKHDHTPSEVVNIVEGILQAYS